MTGPFSALEIARALIRFPSVTPTDAGALAYLRDVLAAAGFAVELVHFFAPGTPDVLNLWARYGTARPNFAFAGHTDVVPVGDSAKWRFDPFGGEIADGRLYGRGACDMKGGVAASVAAALGFIAKGEFTGSISFLITGDEEGPAVNGTVKLLDWARARGEVFDHCLLGEPTSVGTLGDLVKNGRRGSLTGRLKLVGKQGHVAYPQLADNPLRRLSAALDALQGAPLDAGTGDFLASNLEVVNVDVGNAATNVIPGEARAVFNIRFNDLWTPESLSAEISRRLAKALPADGYELTFEPTNAVAFLTPRGDFTDLVARAIREVTGVETKLSTSGGTSDARFIKDACPVVELGPVPAAMHGIDESVGVEELDALTRIYERALEMYFGG
jgi:succinyl-diaminopimelate desuccinylase